MGGAACRLPRGPYAEAAAPGSTLAPAGTLVSMDAVWIVLAVLVVLLVVLAAWDLVQPRHAILRNFPIIGHLRYLLEKVGPELRQYIVTGNDVERPFSRDQRTWIYTSSKERNNFSSFGTDNDLDRARGHLIVKHAAFPAAEPAAGSSCREPDFVLPPAIVFGQLHDRRHAFRPASIVNISGMSFGALGAKAVEALNRGAALAGCLQVTGEGGIAPAHRHGGELVLQVGTGYFGVRDAQGAFSLERLVEQVEGAPVRAIEIKLSQGAKPGHGGILPGAKVTPEIAAIRGVPVGVDCISPAGHSAFSDVDSMIDVIERIADATGLPVGIKSAVGDLEFWQVLADRMRRRGEGPDFITIDGGEGGTGAAPYAFADHVSLPFRIAMPRVYGTFAEEGLADKVPFVGSGRLGFPVEALTALALGCDVIHVGREAMLAIGCIQAQRCHTGHCPSGVATQSAWLQRGLVPDLKAERLARYVRTLRKELLELARTCGHEHPGFVRGDQLEVLGSEGRSRTLDEVYGLPTGHGRPSEPDRAAVLEAMGIATGPGATSSAGA
jgi:glutamate synthase domain-containing protein 2